MMNKYLKATKDSLYIMLFCSIIFALDYLLPLNMEQFGIAPRSGAHIFGIILAPFIHLNFQHLLSNFLPFIILGTLIGFKDRRRFWILLSLSILGTGVLVWCLARGNTTHIGMSGVIYSFWGYLIVYGIVRKQAAATLISVLVIIFYGGLVFGVFPGKIAISFESHLFGAIVGGLSGYYFAKKDSLILKKMA